MFATPFMEFRKTSILFVDVLRMTLRGQAPGCF